MWHWIAQNKEWLVSGAGITSLAIVLWAVRKLLLRSTSAATPTALSAAFSNAASQPQININVSPIISPVFAPKQSNGQTAATPVKRLSDEKRLSPQNKASIAAGLSKLLKDRRGQATIRKFASEIGISASTLSRIEKGHVPTPETLLELCHKLGFNPGDILQLGTRPSAKSTIYLPAEGCARVHFRADSQLTPNAAEELAKLILAKRNR